MIPRTRAAAGPRLAGAAALTLALCAGCVSAGQDLHLSPLYSNLSTPGGGREIEALAGVVRVRRPAPGAPVSDWAVRPLVSHEFRPRGDSLTRFLVPLGTRTEEGDEMVFQLLPVARYQQNKNDEGRLEWRLVALPGILWSHDDSGRTVRAIFPIGGVVEGFLTYDRIEFVLFPLFMRTQRAGRTSWHFLAPVFAYSKGGPGDPSWRVWPLYGRNTTANYDRMFFLWPIWHYHRNHLQAGPREIETTWMLMPIYGRTERGTFQAHAVLWPFFGWSHDAESGFRAWDGPWPLVRIQRPGTSGRARRTRFWPLYSFYGGDGLESTWVGWPIFNRRHETYEDGRRRGTVLLPFWQSWERFDLADRSQGSWTKLWPLLQRYVKHDESGVHSRLALPALNPAWHLPVIDDHYAFLYELYTRERNGEAVRERSWGGIWRRDVDPDERRTYLAGLWSSRVYREDGEVIRERSLLFGLLRWRSRERGGMSMLAPRFPGPGWPARRSSATPEAP